MILSRTCQYAIQALVFIASRPGDRPVMARAISDHLNVPGPYLAKIMQGLSRAGLVDSFRGPSGGFVLRAEARDTSLEAVAALMEPPGAFETCVLGLKACEDANPCPMHRDWKPIKTQVLSLLTRKTVGQLEAAVRTGRYRIADVPYVAFAAARAARQTRPVAVPTRARARRRRAKRASG